MQPSQSHEEEAPPLEWGGHSPRTAAGFSSGVGSPLSGLLSSVLGSVGGGGRRRREGSQLRTSRSTSDLESPLLPGGDQEEQQLIGHLMAPKQWPQLRGSSVSARRITHPAAPVELPTSPLARGGPASPFSSPAGPQAAAGAAGGTPAGQDALPSGPAVARKAAASEPKHAGRYTRAAVAGLVNAVIALPLQLSFAAIIFRVGAALRCFITSLHGRRLSGGARFWRRLQSIICPSQPPITTPIGAQPHTRSTLPAGPFLPPHAGIPGEAGVPVVGHPPDRIRRAQQPALRRG